MIGEVRKWTDVPLHVPIFHDDVTFILQAEIPHVTILYINNVPIKGPTTTYRNVDDSYKTIPENPGICRFVWEHFENLNRVVQRMVEHFLVPSYSFVCRRYLF
jgi:hypothetical protein